MMNKNFQKNSPVKLKTGIFLYALLLTCLAGLTAHAQLYTRTTFNAAYSPITVGGGATVSTATGNDVNQTGILLGFTFNYAGINYTSLGLNTNGLLWFDSIAPSAAEGSAIDRMYRTVGTNKSISAWFCNMADDTASTILYRTNGIPGSRTFTVQYTNYPHYTGAIGTNIRLNNQVIFYEGTNVLEFHYGAISVSGPPTPSSGACIAIEYGAGGEGNFLDLVTGSGSTAHGMLSPLSGWPSYNYRLTPGAPTPVAAGTYNVGVGQTYRSLTLATSDLNHRGISGPVTLNLTDANYDTTAANGSHIFPVFVGPVAGTSAINTLTISKLNAPATLTYKGSPIVQGGFGSGSGLGSISDSQEPIMGVCASYTTVSNINLALAAPTGNPAEVGLMVFEAHGGTTGAQHNLFDKIHVDMDRTNSGTIAIFSNNISGPGGYAGSNSYNTFRDITIRDSYAGIYLEGVGTATGPPDIANQIISSSCSTYNSIGDPSVPNDIGGGSSASYGIRLGAQENFIVRNNIVRNVTTTGSNATVEGITCESLFTSGEVSNNIVRTITRNHSSGNNPAIGIKLTTSGNSIKQISAFNNSISEILSTYAGVPTVSIKAIGLSVVGSGNSGKQKVFIHNNSVSINGSTFPNGSNTCLQITEDNAEHVIKNNVFANFTPAQTGIARHYCFDSFSDSSIGYTTLSASDFNDLYIAHDQGTTGFVGSGNTTDFSTLAAWQAAITKQPGTDANSVSANPFFANNNSNLHATTASAALDGTGTTPPVYVTTDIDCETRTAPHDIGSDQFTPGCPADGGVVSPANATVCAATTYEMSAAGVSVAPGTTYQWMVSTTSGGPYSNVSGGNGAATTTYTTGPLTYGTYYYVLRTTCGNGGTDLSNQLKIVVKATPAANITAAGATTFCSGGSVVLNTPNDPNRSYQWKKSGVIIPGSTGASYTATTTGHYKAVVTNTISGCSKTSPNTIHVVKNTDPPANITPQGPTTFCAGGSVVLQANTGAGLTYKWKRNGSYIAGATASSYTATIAGNYRAEVTRTGCTKTSAAVSVTVPCKTGGDQLSSVELQISVYPNPANSEIHISSDLTGNYEVEISNALGEKLLLVRNQNTIDISAFANGIYFVKVSSGGQAAIEKFIKQ